MSKVCATIYRSAGNASVGEEWIETASFAEHATLSEVMEWADRRVGCYPTKGTSVNVTLSRLQEAPDADAE